jgi:NAD(P)-dependent dehydrogenase (short-subunit alcohol dehydrogenase family)
MALSDKVVLVTGASGSIGRAIAVELAKQGATVALLARSTAGLRQTADAVVAAGGRALVFPADITDRGAVSSAVAETARQGGRLDIVVNNAGLFEGGPFLETTHDTWQRMLDVNLLGIVHCTRECLEQMLPQKSGHVINVASVAGRVGTKMMSAYGVCKHALIGLTRCLALELIGAGIAVNAVCPTMVDTGMADLIVDCLGQNLGMTGDTARAALLAGIPLGRFLAPQEVAESVLWLATMNTPLAYTGQCVDINGGRLMV